MICLSDFLKEMEPAVVWAAYRNGKPAWRDDLAQAYRMAVVRAYETWTEDGGATLKQWAHRHIRWATGHAVRKLHGNLGYRWGQEQAPQTVSLASPAGDDGWTIADLLDADDDGHITSERKMECAHVLAAVRRALANRRTAEVPEGLMVERLLAGEREMAEVAKRQGVSREAVRRSRAKMIHEVREELGL